MKKYLFKKTIKKEINKAIFRALSSDRWHIKALYRTLDGKDAYAQNAKIISIIENVNNSSICWKNLIETYPYEKNQI